MTTTNAELIAEAVEDAFFCWAGEGPPDAQFIASRVTAALESATTVTDENLNIAAQRFYEASGLILPGNAKPQIVAGLRASLAHLAALTEGERR